MPSKEEIEAIGRIKYNDIAKPLACGDLTICNIEDLEIVINLAERQQKELEQLEAERKEVIKKTEEKIEELEDILELCETDGKIAKYKMENLKEQISDLKEILEFMKGK